MIYDTFANVARSAAHSLIDITFPRTAGIATITGCASWLAHKFAVADAGSVIQGWLHPRTINFIKNFPPLEYAINAVEFIPDQISYYMPNPVTEMIDIRKGITKLLAAELIPYAPLICSIMVGTATSTALNLLHIGIIKAYACWKWVFSNEKEVKDDQHVTPGYRKEAPAAPPLKRNIEIPIYKPHSAHGIYFQAGTAAKV